MKHDTDHILRDLRLLLDYLWDDKQQNYKECDDKRGHVFEILQKIDAWLESGND